jgi:hypothetical protein
MDLEKMTIKELTELYNSMAEGKKVKKFESKAKAIARVKKLLPEKKARKVTKMSIIREMFQDKASWTRDQIMRRTGFDSKNAHAAMNVLKNPNRTKDPLNFIYDRENQTYNLVSHGLSDN